MNFAKLRGKRRVPHEIGREVGASTLPPLASAAPMRANGGVAIASTTASMHGEASDSAERHGGRTATGDRKGGRANQLAADIAMPCQPTIVRIETAFSAQRDPDGQRCEHVSEEHAGEPAGRMACAEQEKCQRKPGDRGEREEENVKGAGETVADDARRKAVRAHR